MEDLFQLKKIINPLFGENALIKLVEGSLEECVEKKELWQVMGPIKNLPLDYWSNQMFKVIGDHFGGLENIASD